MKSSLLAVGFCAGLLAGLLGVGGGIILVPAMVLLYKKAQHIAQGTSLLAIIPAAIAGSAVHLYNGNIDLAFAALLTAGSLLGAYAGANAVAFIPEKKLKKSFAIFIIIVGLKMALW
ncbi:MAG: sulfite exporter TauE/SafE family protein [Halobacteria archaeon]